MKKTITFLSRRATMMLLATLLLTLTAQTAWAQNFTVNFDKCDGEYGDDYVQATLGEQMPQITPPTREGYTFGGYFTHERGDGTQYYDADGNSTHEWDIEEDATLFAKWTPITYTVVFDANGGEGEPMDEQVFTYDEAQDLSHCTYFRNGRFAFDGWATSEDGEKVFEDGANLLNLTSIADKTVTLYAHWAETPDATYYTGTYDVDADTDIPGTIIVVGDVTLNVSAALTFGEIRPEGGPFTLNVLKGGFITSTGGILANEFNMTGGTVNAGSLAADNGEISGGTLDITNVFITQDNIISGGNIRVGNYLQINGDLQFKAEHANMSIYAKEYDFNIGSLTITGDRGFSDGTTVYNPGTIASDNISSLNEKTLRPAYTVSYDANGGTGSVASQTKCSGIDLTLASAGFTRTGYTLDGWATSANGDKVYELGGTYSANADLLPLYAHWTANTYSVRFNKNSDDASGTMDNQSFTYDEAAKALTANTFTREGYVFAGWATTVDGAVAYADGAEVQNLTAEANGIIDLYAKWRENIPYIDADGIEQTCTDYTLLRTDNPEHLNFSNLPGGWYVVENWTDGADFSNNGTLHFQGDTHLILCDGAEISVNHSNLQSSGTLTIYGQSGSSGAINIDNESAGILAYNDLIINGGIISVSTNESGYAIDCRGNVVINGGRVTATAPGWAISGVNGVVINGGKVTATAQEAAINGLNIAINGGTVIANGPVDNYATIAEQMIDFTISGTNKRIITESIDGDVVTALQTLFGNNASVDASFKRTFKGGVASTICLPFPMTSITDAGTMYGFVGVTYDETDGWVATMIDTSPDGDNRRSTTEANTPYLFKLYSDGAVTFTGTINTASITADYSTSGDWTFQGTYSRLTYETTESNSNPFSGKAFGFAANSKGDVVAGEFVRAISGAYIPAFRAFLKYSGDETSLQARGTRGGGAGIPETITVRLLGKNGEIDGIGEIRLSTGEVTFDPNAWYDLSGRKLDGKPTQRGIYINNGRKVAIK